MASIHIESTVDVSADTTWEALRRVGDAQALFAPVLAGSEMRGDTRTARFGNGLVVHERVVDVNDAHRRVAYACSTAPASPTITPRCRSSRRPR
jgi:hypothetical protein